MLQESIPGRAGTESRLSAQENNGGVRGFCRKRAVTASGASRSCGLPVSLHFLEGEHGRCTRGFFPLIISERFTGREGVWPSLSRTSGPGTATLSGTHKHKTIKPEPVPRSFEEHVWVFFLLVTGSPCPLVIVVTELAVAPCRPGTQHQPFIGLKRAKKTHPTQHPPGGEKGNRDLSRFHAA